MGALSSGLDILDGIFRRWFSKEARDEARDNDIDELQKKQANLAIHNVDGRFDNELKRISTKLSKLQRQAQNTR